MQFKGVMCEIWATITRVTGSCRYFANQVEYLSVENPFDPSYFILFSHHYFVLMFCTAQLREMLRLFCCSARGQ